MASISIQVLAILASWYVWAKDNNLLLGSCSSKINIRNLLNGLIKLDSLGCSDKIAPKRNCHKFLFKLSLVFCCGRHHSFYGNTKTCVIVSTLVFIFLLFLVKNRERDTLKNRCFAISNMLPCRSPYFSRSCKGINYARLQKNI